MLSVAFVVLSYIDKMSEGLGCQWHVVELFLVMGLAESFLNRSKALSTIRGWLNHQNFWPCPHGAGAGRGS